MIIVANFNYRLINKFDFTMADSSIRGMEKVLEFKNRVHY